MLKSRKFRRVAKIIGVVLVCYILVVHMSFTRTMLGFKHDDNNIWKNKYMPEEPSVQKSQEVQPVELEVQARIEQFKNTASHKPGKLSDHLNKIGKQDNLVNQLHDKNVLHGNHSDQVCPSLRPGNLDERLDVWYTIPTSSTAKLHVYSAFLDRRDRTIKVMAVASGQSKQFCQIWLQVGDQIELHVTEASWNLIPETHGFRFVPYIISCALPDKIAGGSPRQVSLSHEKCSDPTHALPIQIRPEPFVARYNFTVCLTPVNRAYDRLGEFLEYMEVNGMFGADHFVFYDHQIGDALTPFIETYKREDKLSVWQWKIPVETTQGPTNEIHYFGQVLALNDCMYRARLHSKYVAFLDFDEIIVPMHHNNWLDLMSDLSEGGAISKTFIFPNVFFRQEWEVDPTYSKNPFVNKLQLRTLLYTKREHKTWPHQMRSKYISPSNALKSVGIHFPWNAVNSVHSVSAADGILFHYRNWEDYSAASYTNQTRMFDFADTILHRIKQRIDKAKVLGYKDIV